MVSQSQFPVQFQANDRESLKTPGVLICLKIITGTSRATTEIMFVSTLGCVFALISLCFGFHQLLRIATLKLLNASLCSPAGC